MRHINSLCSYSMSIPSLPAPPTRHAISGPQAIIPSKDIILWTPIGLPVSAGLHVPALTIPPIPSPSSITEERTHRPTPQLEYPTKDLIVWERYTAELVDAIEPIPLVACGIIIVCCACVMAMVFHSRYSDKVKARVSDVLVSDQSSSPTTSAHHLLSPLSLSTQMPVQPCRSATSSR